MKTTRSSRICIWALVLCFVTQITWAQNLGVSGEIVPSDTQPKATAPKVSGEIVPSDAQPKTAAPKVSGEIVPSDSQPKAAVPKVSGEIVPSDAQPRTTTPKSGIPAVNPFVGEIAVGASLLITYGPQILALAMSVATIAAAINAITGKGKETAGLASSVGGKLKTMLQLLLGPLAISNGAAKEGVEGVGGELLRTAKFITNNLSMPVDKVNGHVERALYLSKDAEKISARGQGISELMVKLAAETNQDLDRVIAGGEVQLFRDGTKNVIGALSREAQRSGTAFERATENSKLSVAALTEVKGNIEDKLNASGKAASEVTLYDLGISSAEVSKKLIDARKYMVMSRNELADAEKATGLVHSEILGILGSIKKELEAFARNNGISDELLARTIKEQKSKGSALDLLGVRKDSAKPEAARERLSQEVSFLVDDLGTMNRTANRLLKQVEKAPAAATAADPMFQESAAPDTARSDAAFAKKLSAYRSLMKVMAKDPGNRQALQEAKAAYELAERELAASQK